MKKQLSQKQQAALEAGRNKRLTKLKAEQYVEALRMNQKVKKADEKIITYQNFEARIKLAQKDLKLKGKTATRAAAIKAIKRSATFLSQKDIYKQAIIDYMSIGDKNSLRKLIADKQGTKYKETTIDWNRFNYDATHKSIVDSVLGIYVKIVPGADSTEPDFIEIGEC